MFTPQPHDLRTAHEAGLRGVPLHEDGYRVVFGEFSGDRRSDRWTPGVADGHDIVVRRADCGSGCRCAAEFRFA